MPDPVIPANVRLVGYNVNEELDSGLGWNFDLTVPGSMSEIDMSTCHLLGRYGGLADADHEFRRELYFRLGGIVVGSGHVEMAMKRSLLVLRGMPSRVSLVDKTWTGLHQDLLAECTGADPVRLKLKEAMDWGDVRRVKWHRDNIVHSYWWNYSGPSARAGRTRHKKEGNSTIDYTFADLDNVASDIFEYAGRLDDLTGNRWSVVALPSTPQLPVHAREPRSPSE